MECWPDISNDQKKRGRGIVFRREKLNWLGGKRGTYQGIGEGTHQRTPMKEKLEAVDLPSCWKLWEAEELKSN